LDDGSDAFAGRTPLYGYYSARLPQAGGGGTTDAFDFQILGVHLKAMASGHAQRLESAKVLSSWLKKDAPTVDSDVLIMGDWNAPPDDSCWKPFHDLEGAGNVAFRKINDPTDYSYLWLANKKDKFMSRIDLTLASVASMRQVVGQAAQVVKWKPIEEALAIAGDYADKEVVRVLKEIKETISDHLPTVTRFYFTESQER
jgi:endonuclease/exonuclease/phosphatase family metal-dependent hydrolase